MPTDKYGKKLTWKEYMARWKKGIEEITPYQQAKTSFISTWVILIGIVSGIIFSLFTIVNLWWLIIILLGALGNTVVVQIANYQKLIILRRLEDEFQ